MIKKGEWDNWGGILILKPRNIRLVETENRGRSGWNEYCEERARCISMLTGNISSPRKRGMINYDT